MEYFNSLTIEHYKGVRSVSVSNLASVNLIIGPNGCGKTSFLQAVSLMNHFSDPSHYIDINGGTYDGFVNSFDKQEPRPYTKISATVHHQPYYLEWVSYEPLTPPSFCGYLNYGYPLNGVCRSKQTKIHLTFPVEDHTGKTPPILPCKMIDQKMPSPSFLAIAQDDLVRERVLSYLSLLDENLIRFETMASQDSVLIHKNFGPIHAGFFGNGITNFLKIAHGFANFQNGILLIDAMETEIAKNSYEELVQMCYCLAKEKQIQLFLTTHSQELLDEWLDTMHFYHDLSHFKLICLRAAENKTIAQEYSGKQAYERRMEEQWDFFRQHPEKGA